jgi:ribonuclease D
MLQLATEDKTVHIVRFPSLDSYNAIRLLAAPRVHKIFHHAGFDLRFIYAYMGVVTSQPIECTKTLMKMLYPGSKSGIGYTILKSTGIRLPSIKVDYTKWCVPELSDNQIEYAASDVIALIPALRNLRAQLNEVMWHKYRRAMEGVSILAEMDVDGFDDLWAYRQNSRVEALKKREWRSHYVHSYRLMRYQGRSTTNCI